MIEKLFSLLGYYMREYMHVNVKKIGKMYLTFEWYGKSYHLYIQELSDEEAKGW